MTFEFDDDVKVSDMPFMATSESNQWVDIAYKLKSVRVEKEEKPWGKDAKVHYAEMNHGDDQGWHEEEIPFWAVKLFLDFASEFGNKKGDLKCEYMRTEVWNKKEDRMDNKAKFRVEE